MRAEDIIRKEKSLIGGSGKYYGKTYKQETPEEEWNRRNKKIHKLYSKKSTNRRGKRIDRLENKRDSRLTYSVDADGNKTIRRK